jgi:Na+-transporting methylmalonyl-CoA/oxaloacetate decarboxylase beta subunit
VTERLTRTAQNELINLITILLGLWRHDGRRDVLHVQTKIRARVRGHAL